MTVKGNAIVEGGKFDVYATQEVSSYTFNYSESTRYAAVVFSDWATGTYNGVQRNAGQAYYLYEDLATALTASETYIIGTTTVELNASVNNFTGVTVAYPCTIDGNGFSVVAAAGKTAFTVGANCTALALNDVTVVADTVLGGYADGKTVSTNAKAIADKLNAEGYALEEANGVWTVVSNAPEAQVNGWNYATFEKALAALT